jgi:D-alanine-D-alanine ligase
MDTIAVIFGGRSTEHDVSIVTALANVIKPLELTKKYNVQAVYIDKDGAWYCDEKLKDISLFSSGAIKEFLAKSKPVDLDLDGGLKLVKPSGITGRKQFKKIDIAFPAMHGTYGEDGALMGLLDMAGIPYVGCDMTSAAIAMDKVLAKQVAQASGIAVSKFLSLTKSDVEKDNLAGSLSKIEEHLNYPLFVKPAHLGSSIGITRVSNLSELNNGLEVAAHYDQRIIIEEAVNNLIEVTLPILGNETPKAALLERPLTDAEDFFDFDTKYLHGGKKGGSKSGAKSAQGYSELPAKLDKSLYDKAEKLGLDTYKALGCSGTCRIDMLIDSKTNEVYFNEANPLPGSLYAHNWNKAGLSNVALVTELVDLALDRFKKQKDLTTSFSTNYLKQF